MSVKANKNILRLVKLVGAVLLAAHLIGCLFFLVGNSLHRLGKDNWADAVGIVRPCTWGIDLPGGAGGAGRESGGSGSGSGFGGSGLGLGLGFNSTAGDAETGGGWVGDQGLGGAGLEGCGAPSSGLIYTQYLHALYWAVTVIYTVGYGDIVPVDDVEKG